MRLRAATICALLVAALASQASAAGPVVNYTLTGTHGQNGWWVSNVVVHWTVEGATGNTTGCEAAVLIDADTAGTTRTCTAPGDGGATTTVKTETIKIDKTPPVATAANPARAPDVGVWFTQPVTVQWSGTDNLSPNPVCTSTTYSGPDSAGAVLSGTCRDAAGNVSDPLPFTLPYDVTPPSLTGLAATAGDGTAIITWQVSPDTNAIAVARSPAAGFAVSSAISPAAGRFVDTHLVNDVRYTYVVTASDAAGNSVHDTVVVTPGRLLTPLPFASLTSPPVLSWVLVPGASYYNVQIFREGRKVLSLWPVGDHVAVPNTWRFNGRRMRLSPGTYRWYVWPGFGRRAKHRYGQLLGKRDFTLTQ